MGKIISRVEILKSYLTEKVLVVGVERRGGGGGGGGQAVLLYLIPSHTTCMVSPN